MRRSPVRLLVVLLALGLAAAACGDDDDDTAASTSAPTASATAAAASGTTVAATTAATAAASTAPPTTAAPTTTAPTTTTAPAVLQMGQTTLLFEDTSRSTNAVQDVVAASPTRKLPTLVSYPAATAGTDVPVAGGPYPLLVFSHGITANVHEFDEVYPALAAVGYVVAAPDFPETTGGPDFRAIGNVVNQPDDVKFVVDSMLEANDDPASPFHGTIDPARIGLGGHSLGAITTLLTVYNTRYGDPRIKAVYESAGSLFPVDGGTYDFAGKPPLLIIHGDADGTVPYQASLDLYPQAQPPKIFITVLGAGHSTYLHAGDPGLAPHNDAVVGFFDTYLRLSPDGAARLMQADVPGVTTVQADA